MVASVTEQRIPVGVLTKCGEARALFAVLDCCLVFLFWLSRTIKATVRGVTSL